MLSEQARQTSESPAQIIQTAITNNSQNIYPYLSLYNAIQQTIQRVYHLDLPIEPLTLDSFVIPDHMKQTLKGSEFLISDTTVNQSRILIFTTANNIRHLNRSPYWIMGCIGGNKNSRIMPFVFSLMTKNPWNLIEGCFKI
ncbi:hypothetical protein F8M41_013747 [Gigaspora margarita]|uniref:MULE transposase domain-containing protein n=1 Tax=Gigaspora margarita TaxID=4874 RepID=A0A8H4EV02_GIGMA|nr:hypothetical protein F8M41_013747 [Gigaspora margarita]